MKNTYTKEFKLKIIRKYFEGDGITFLTREYNISKSAIRKWVAQYNAGEREFPEKRGKSSSVNGVKKGRNSSIDVANMTDKEIIAHQAMEIEILKKISEVEASTGLNKYKNYVVVMELASKYPITKLCKYLKVSTSSYYYFKKNYSNPDAELMEIIKNIHSKRVSSGYRTIKRELFRKHNMVVNFKRILRIMRLLNIKGKQKRSNYENFSKAIKASTIYPNILNRNFSATSSNQKWVIDITYIKEVDKNTYLICIKDLYDKRIVSYENSDSMSMRFVLKCVSRALIDNNIKPGTLILHSDQGVHFTCKLYINLLEKYGVIGSHSRKGNCHDNACIESFFSILKREAFNFKRPINFGHTLSLTKDFINYYNNDRVQGGLDEKTPAEFYQFN